MTKLRVLARFIHDETSRLCDVVWEVEDGTKILAQYGTEEDARQDLNDRLSQERLLAHVRT